MGGREEGNLNLLLSSQFSIVSGYGSGDGLCSTGSMIISSSSPDNCTDSLQLSCGVATILLTLQ